MSVTIVGDSNFRDLFTKSKDEIETESGSEVEFVQATSVASVKAYLETLVKKGVVFIGYPMNEIGQKSRNNTKSREGIVEAVIADLYTQVNVTADRKEDVMFVICQPFLRLDPPWIKGKLTFMSDHLKTTHNCTGSKNVHLGSVIEAEADDLKADNVHLNEKGLLKLKNILTTDIKVAKNEFEILQTGGQDESMEEAVTPVNIGSKEARELRKTPARRKRPHEDTNADSQKGKHKKKKDGIEAVLDKLDLMMERLDGDRAANMSRFNVVEQRLEESSKAHENLKKEVDNIKKSDNNFAATVREDLDAVENINLRDTVIVKKLATEAEIPKDKKDLTNLIMTTAREIITQDWEVIRT
jgi:hypothetical protein